MSPLKLASLLLFVCNLCYGYKILVYSPKFGTSHVNFMGKLADILVKAGHEVVGFLHIFKGPILSKKIAGLLRVWQKLDFCAIF